MRHLSSIALAAAFAGCALSTAPVASTTRAITAPWSGACVTHGTADSFTWFQTDDPVMRAFVPGTTGTTAKLTFFSKGVTTPEVPLASGSVRHQACLKLRAQDGCNLVYACWRLEPHPWIQVQIKSNPGESSSDQCGAGGYSSVVPTWTADVPSYRLGQHILEADLIGTALSIGVDGAAVWTGSITPEAALVDGPAGVRSDNERWQGSLVTDLDCSVGGD